MSNEINKTINDEIDELINDKKENNEPKKKKRSFKMVTAFTMLIFIITFFVILSWILHYTGVTTKVGEETQKIKALGILDIFYAPFKGFENKADIIVFILAIGGFINIVLITKSLEGLSQSVAKKLKGKEIWIIPILMFFFSICGTTEGMAEESLGFYMILVPLMIIAGFDTITGWLIVLIGAGAGVMGSTVNPFLVTVAVDAITTNTSGSTGWDITVGDGLAWRFIGWLIITGTAIAFVIWYANKVKKSPEKSITFSTREEDKEFFLQNTTEEIVMDWRKITALVFFFITLVMMIVYLIGWDEILNLKNTPVKNAGDWVNNNMPWLTSLIPGLGQGGFIEISPFFLIGGIAIGALNWKGEKKFVDDFIAGMTDILSVCLVIATATGIGVILTESHEQELIVSSLIKGLDGIPDIPFLILLFIVFLPLSFLIPSTSGFAAAIFPLLAGTTATGGIITGAIVPGDPTDPAFTPVAVDAIKGSGSITAFSYACGILNFVTPTSGVVMGSLAISRISYDKLWKVLWPFILVMVLLSIILLSIGGLIGGKIF